MEQTMLKPMKAIQVSNFKFYFFTLPEDPAFSTGGAHFSKADFLRINLTET
jgi:hypothetical protein